ncbi:MAG: cobalamin-dependent protein, partial [Chloroflexi bacterium]|nr:cobalamin-dependent protein [Chloroflexota bacterium]
MRVLLISTPYPLEENPIPSLSLSYLAGVLQEEGIEVQILDLLVAQYSSNKIRNKLEEYQPQVVGATCVTLNYPIAARILRVCKDFDPNIVTVMGGPHASFTLKETLLRAPWIDVVVIREGERTLVELVRALEKGIGFGQVAGIAFREDKHVVETEPRPPIKDLDELPVPARNLLPLSRYRALGAPCNLTTSRGCPYGCIFCSGRRMFGRKVRFRHPRLVVDEMEIIHKELGFEKMNIVDDTFTV